MAEENFEELVEKLNEELNTVTEELRQLNTEITQEYQKLQNSPLSEHGQIYDGISELQRKRGVLTDKLNGIRTEFEKALRGLKDEREKK